MPDHAVPTGPEIERITDAGTAEIRLRGHWNLKGLGGSLPETSQRLKEYAADAEANWNLESVDALDSAGSLLLLQAWGGKPPAKLTLRPEHQALFARNQRAEQELPPAPVDPLYPIIVLGQLGYKFANHTFGFLVLLGQLAIDIGRLVADPARTPWREFSATIYKTGLLAMPITGLVGFLIGVVISYLSAQQLQAYGADIFIINILGVSIVRELGPVLAAILIAGRSGSSMTAQIGVMRVTQELDALGALGISQTQRLILPKIAALAVSLPLIVLWTDAMALFGGMVTVKLQLGIGFEHFLSRLPDTVPIANLWIGVGKGVVFGILIAAIASHFGLRIKPNTESLGAGTTSSVVTSITAVILTDAVFAVVFSKVGI